MGAKDVREDVPRHDPVKAGLVRSDAICDERRPEPIAAENRASVETGMEQALRGQFASNEEVEATYRRADP